MRLYLAALSLLLLNSCTKSVALPVKDSANKNSLSAADASQLRSWTPPWAQVGVMVSNPRLPFQIVEELKETYQEIPAVTKAARGLSFRHPDGTRMTAAKWGGLDFSRGFAAFSGPSDSFRLVFGVTNLQQGLQSVVHVFKTNFGTKASSTKTTLNLSVLAFQCIEQNGLAICDTVAKPSQPENALARITNSQAKDDIAWGFAVASGRLAENVQHFVFALRSTEQSIGGHLTAHLQPEARMMGSMFLGDKPQKSALRNVVSGGGFLHVNIPDASLQQLQNRFASPPKGTPSKNPIARILNGLNGDYTLTTDGSLFNLVMALGVQSKAAADTVMDGLLEILAQVGCPKNSCSKLGPSKTVDGGQVLSLSFSPSKSEKMSVDLHHAYVNNELVFALSPADLRRRLDSAWTSHKPIELSSGTLLQANIGNPFILMNSAWMREIVALGTSYDLTTLLSAKMADFGESRMALRFVDNALQAHIQLARLPKDGDGAELYADSVAASLLGDNLKANLGWHKLAAEYPNRPLGHAGKNRAFNLGPMGPVLVGILGAVAVPAFMKYVRRSKTSEATTNVRKLFDGAVAYAHGRSDKDSPVFPESTPLTPGNPTQFMCKDGESRTYKPTADTFSHPSWQALNFAVTDPFFYAYQFESKNQGGTSMFTVRAVGDLDCDGILSTFERIGTMDKDGKISGGAGLFTKNELE